MVEGPGCKVKGQKLRARIRGQTLKKVGGKVVEKVRNGFHRRVGLTMCVCVCVCVGGGALPLE